MAEFEIQSVPLPPLSANSDLSNWFDILESIGFNKVYYDDVLQLDRMVWKNTNIGVLLSNMYFYLVKFRDDHSTINVSQIITASMSTTINITFFYRYMRNTNNILFGMNLNTTSTPTQQLYAAITEPEDENDVWSAYISNTYIGANDNSAKSIGNTNTLSYVSPPVTSVGLIPFWFAYKFKTKVFHVPIMPLIPVGSVFKTIIGDRVYLVNDWARSSRYTGIAFDITEEFN